MICCGLEESPLQVAVALIYHNRDHDTLEYAAFAVDFLQVLFRYFVPLGRYSDADLCADSQLTSQTTNAKLEVENCNWTPHSWHEC